MVWFLKEEERRTERVSHGQTRMVWLLRERERESPRESPIPNLDGVVLETALVGVGAATDGTLVLFVGCLLDVVLVVPHMVVEIGHLSKSPVTTIKTTAVRLLPYNVSDNKYRDRHHRSYIKQSFGNHLIKLKIV